MKTTNSRSNEDIVLKLFCPVRFNSYELELRLHKGPLEERGYIPQVRFWGKSPAGYDYIGFTRIQGQPFRKWRPASAPDETIVELAQVLASLQTRTLDRGDDEGAGWQPPGMIPRS